MRWFTADLHFGHTNIIVYCNRPYRNVNKMNEGIIQRINNRVGKDDMLYILGDIGKIHGENIEHLAFLLSKIKCRLVLILGNHDKLRAFDYVDMGFESVHTHMYIEDLDVHLTHDPANACMLPSQAWLCGHVHNLFKVVRNVFNVGVDVNEFNPVSEDEVKEWVKRFKEER